MTQFVIIVAEKAARIIFVVQNLNLGSLVVVHLTIDKTFITGIKVALSGDLIRETEERLCLVAK